jgi:ethanolamine ammonia-lyase large subunit
MPHFSHTLGQRRYVFDDLTSLLAKASPPKSGDQLAGISAAILKPARGVSGAACARLCAARSTAAIQQSLRRSDLRAWD